MPVITLGIETSGFDGTVALRIDGRDVEQRALDQTRRRHAQTLIAEVRTILANHSLRPRDVSRIAVSIGPGSFTGLRVGVVCASTFAYATGCEVVPVDTLLSVAANAPDHANRCLIIADAQREQLFVGDYRRETNHAGQVVWQRSGEIVIADGAAWCRDVAAELTAAESPGSVLVGGPVLERWRHEFCDCSDASFLDSILCVPRAGTIARLGEAATSDSAVAPELLEPFYLRRSSAEEKRDARAAAGE